MLRGIADEVIFDYLTADSSAYWSWADEIRRDRWIGDNPFFLGPLYPYWLALVRGAVGDTVGAVVRIQLLLGSLTAVVIADATRRIASARAGAIAGILAGGYAMSVIFEMQILMEGLLLFLGALLLWSLARTARAPAGMAAAFVNGLLIGAMAQGRPTGVLLVIPCIVALGAWRPAWRPAAAVVAVGLGIGVFSVPVGIRHVRTAGSFLPFTYSLGFNAYLGNGPGANGTHRLLQETEGTIEPTPRSAEGSAVSDGRRYLSEVAGRELTHSESSREWLRRTTRHVVEHPGTALRLVLLKLGLMGNHRELPQIANLHTLASAGGIPVWVLELEFSVLLIGGMAGLAVAWRRRGVSRALVAWLLVVWLSGAAFFVVDRYRIHLVIPLVALAALAADAAWERLRGRGTAEVRSMTVGAVCAAVLAFLPLVPSSRAHQRWSEVGHEGSAWLEREDYARAAELLGEAAAIDRSGALPAETLVTARILRASVFEELGMARERLGDDRGAAEGYRAAAALVPTAASPRALLAAVLARNGERETALRELARAGIPPGERTAGLVTDAVRLVARGDTAGMRRVLLSAVALSPGDERAVVPLVRLALREGALGFGEQLLADARAAGLDPNVRLAHEAWLATARGEHARAAALLSEIPSEIRSGDPRVVSTLELMRESLLASPPPPPRAAPARR